jgi:hypothetical protein
VVANQFIRKASVSAAAASYLCKFQLDYSLIFAMTPLLFLRFFVVQDKLNKSSEE